MESTLWIFDLEQIRASLAGASLPPTGRVLARLTGSLNGESYWAYAGAVISQLRWAPDGDAVFFRAAMDGENHQLFKAKLNDTNVIAMTPRDQDVIAYDAGSQDIVYLMRPAVSETELWNSAGKGAPEILIGTGQSIWGLLYPEWKKTKWSGPAALWRLQIGKAPVPVLDRGDHPILINGRSWDRVLQVSPDRARVIVTAFAPIVPRAWADLPIGGAHGAVKIAADLPAPDATQYPWDEFRPQQYFVITLANGDIKPISTEPIADRRRGWAGWPGASWSPDGREIAVVNVYVQSAANVPERPCLVAVKILSDDRTECFRSHNTSDDKAPTSDDDLDNVNWMSANQMALFFVDAPKPELWERNGSRWVHKQTAGDQSIGEHPVRFRVLEGLNDPPILQAEDAATGKMITVLDPNPQLQGIDLGHAEIYKWKDQLGRVDDGVLLLPPDFVIGRRYPLVVQTHGVDLHRFLVTGYSETASAARALAGREIMVLTVNEPEDQYVGTSEESVQNGAMVYIAAIDALVANGFVDRTRVGISGYSRTGLNVARTLLKFPERLAAAVIANTDPGTLGALDSYVDYISPDFLDQVRALEIGPKPSGATLATWLSALPEMQADGITAPVLFSAADPQHLIVEWGLYSQLRQRSAPVELQYMRTGAHNLTKSEQRLAHEELIVDWFDFWLKGHEAPDPRKAEQYARWRKLRQLHTADSTESDREPNSIGSLP